MLGPAHVWAVCVVTAHIVAAAIEIMVSMSSASSTARRRHRRGCRRPGTTSGRRCRGRTRCVAATRPSLRLLDGCRLGLSGTFSVEVIGPNPSVPARGERRRLRNVRTHHHLRRPHRHRDGGARRTRLDLPSDLPAICEDNADYFCIKANGEIVYWSHKGATDETWRNLATWITTSGSAEANESSAAHLDSPSAQSASAQFRQSREQPTRPIPLTSPAP